MVIKLVFFIVRFIQFEVSFESLYAYPINLYGKSNYYRAMSSRPCLPLKLIKKLWERCIVDVRPSKLKILKENTKKKVRCALK